MTGTDLRLAARDAAAVALGAAAAVVFRAAVRPHDPLSLDNLGLTLAVGVPLAVVAALVALAAGGHYRSGAAFPPVRVLLGDLAAGAAVVAFVAFARPGVDAPLLTVAAGYVFCATTVTMSHRFTGIAAFPTRLS
jgi:hypothetical protein